VHRELNLAVFYPLADRPARVVPGNGVDAVSDQFLDQQAGTHFGQQRLEIVGIARHDQILRATRIGGGLQAEPACRVTAQDVTLQHAT
jgi:hypothetical protein